MALASSEAPRCASNEPTGTAGRLVRAARPGPGLRHFVNSVIILIQLLIVPTWLNCHIEFITIE